MSLDFYLQTKCCQQTLANHNITHNLKPMFKEAGVHDILWRGDGKKASDVVRTLRRGLKKMEAIPDHFRSFDSDNGWGTYPNAVEFLRAVIRSCEEHPDGIIYCSV